MRLGVHSLMPSELLPWDRKDRKRERSGSPSAGFVARWRGPPHQGPRDFVRFGSADFRRPRGRGKQGSWHQFPKDSGRGFAVLRPCDRTLEDETYRSFVPRLDGKYNRNSRESRGGSFGPPDNTCMRNIRENRGGSIGPKDSKANSLESNDVLSSAVCRKLDLNAQRSVDDMLLQSSHPQSDLLNTSGQSHFKDQYGKTDTVDGLGPGERLESENSLDSIGWRPLKWSRPGSISLRGPGFSNSSSSKSIIVDTVEAKTDLQPSCVSTLKSRSGEVSPHTNSVPSLVDACSRKKQRLGWGEGLAKYEKKKVDGPDDNVNKNTESVHSVASNLAEKSLGCTDFSDCASPATSSSVSCGSSSGMEDRPFAKALSVGNDTSNSNGSPGSVLRNLLEGLSIDIENSDLNPASSLSASIIELLQFDDVSSGDSSSFRSIAISKLLLWKVDVLKALEITESEIDQLESELKSLKSEPGSCCPYAAAASSSLPAVNKDQLCEAQISTSILSSKPTPLQGFCGDKRHDSVCILEVANAVSKDDIDSSGTVTPDFVQPPDFGNVSPLVAAKHLACSGDHDAFGPKNVEEKKFIGELSVESVCDLVNLTESKTAAPGSGAFNLCADGEDILCDILSYNKDIANRSSEVFNKLLPRGQFRVDISDINKVSSWPNRSLIKQKFATRKRCLRFKERAVTLKFCAFLRLWKEDMHLLSLKKSRSKSQRKMELTSLMPQNGYQKHNSSMRSWISSLAHNSSLVATTPIINCASKLVTDTHIKLYRKTLKMPALILDEEKMASRFLSSNGLVKDPFAIEKERALINPWTSEEKEIFIDKLAVFGKDFRKIASFLDHKKTADCVEFYYKNHKSDCFEKTKKKLDHGKQGKSFPANTYWLTSSKKWNRESNVASLKMLGAASVVAANTDENTDRWKNSSRRFLQPHNNCKISEGNERSSSFNDPGNDKEAAAADVLVGIYEGSSEAMSSCITSTVNPGESYPEWKSQHSGSVTEQPFTPEVMHNVDDEPYSDESCGEIDSTDWTDEEKSAFVHAVSSYGKDFAMISQCVGTRSKNQCKVFFSKARKCLGLDVIHHFPVNVGTPKSDDAAGGGSSAEDSCVVETGSGICNNKSGSKIDVDLPFSVINTNQDSNLLGNVNLEIGTIIANESNVPRAPDLEIFSPKHQTVPDFEDPKSRDNLIPDEYAEIERNQKLDGNSSALNAVSEYAISPVQQNTTSSADMESLSDEETGLGALVEESQPLVAGQFPSGLDVVVEPENVAGVSLEGHGAVSEGQNLLLSNISLIDKQNEKEKSAKTGGQNGLCCSSRKSKSVGDSADMVVDFRDVSSILGVSKWQPCNLPDLDHTLKPSVVSLQEDGSPLIENAKANNWYETTPNQDVSSSMSSFEMVEKPHKQNSECMDSHQQCQAEELSEDTGDPLHMPIKKVIKEAFDCKMPLAVPAVHKENGNLHSSYTALSCYIQQCNDLKDRHLGAEMQLLSQRMEQKNHPRHNVHSLSDMEKPNQNGDVKLFGQILSHPTPLQKLNTSNTHDIESRETHQNKLGSKSLYLKFTGRCPNVDGKFNSPTFDMSNMPTSESLPRSFGFWDGNRQTGHSALPDSAILLAKYPAAFSNYPSSVSKLEQQPLHVVTQNSDDTLTGIPVFSTRKNSRNGVVDIEGYRSRDCVKVPSPFALDMKQEPDIYSEMQWQNSFETVSSLQQQPMGIAGVNVVGRSGVLVGGACSNISDPAAAIKMHYADTGQVRSIIREDEAWKETGDIGSR